MIKSLIIIGAGPFSDRAIMWAKSCGFTVIAIDRNKEAVSLSLADYHVQLDGQDSKSIMAWIRKNRRFTITRAFCGNDFAIPAVFEINNFIDDGQIDHASYRLLTDKIWAKTQLLKSNIPTPTFKIVSSITEAKNAAFELTYPVIIKPSNLSGSIGVQKINSENDWKEIRIQSDSKFVWLIEKLQSGSHHDVNGFILNSEFFRCGVTDRIFSMPDTQYVHPLACLPLEGISPSSTSQNIQNKMYHILEKSAKILGFNDTPVKGDFILTENNEPSLIEITPRFHGEIESAYTIPESTGVNPIYAYFKYLRGDKNWNKYLNPGVRTASGWKAVIINPASKNHPSRIYSSLSECKNIVKFVTKTVEKVNLYSNNSEIPAFLIINGKNVAEVRSEFKRIDKIIEKYQ